MAHRYVNAIISYCEGLQDSPHRCTRRDDIRPGLRSTNYTGRTVIAFGVTAELVSILGVFYGGQDYESFLQADADEL